MNDDSPDATPFEKMILHPIIRSSAHGAFNEIAYGPYSDGRIFVNPITKPNNDYQTLCSAIWMIYRECTESEYRSVSMAHASILLGGRQMGLNDITFEEGLEIIYQNWCDNDKEKVGPDHLGCQYWVSRFFTIGTAELLHQWCENSTNNTEFRDDQLRQYDFMREM